MGNQFTLCSYGHNHRSKLESTVCGILQLRMRAGELTDIFFEEPVFLTHARIKSVPDFKCVTKTGEILYVEAKGHETGEYRIKKKLWKYYGPAPLEVWKGSYLKPLLDQIIVPEPKIPTTPCTD